MNVLLLAVLLDADYLPAQIPGDYPPVENWEGDGHRPWLGPNLWANRLADWEVREGYLMPVNCDPAFPLRTAHVITREVTPGPGGFSLSVLVSAETFRPAACRVGFLIGAGAGLLDWRAAALVHCSPGRGGGRLALLETGSSPRLTFRDNRNEYKAREYEELAGTALPGGLTFEPGREYLLRLDIEPAFSGLSYNLRLSLSDPAGGESRAACILENIPENEVRGSFALAFSQLEKVSRPAIRLREFRAWGEKLRAHPERQFGPVAGVLYSISGGILKLTAQFTPVAWLGVPGAAPAPLKAYLEIQESVTAEKPWSVIDSARITLTDYTARFRLEGWDSSSERAFRVVFPDRDGATYRYEGTLAAEPEPGGTLTLAAFTGMGVMGRTADSGPAPRDQGALVGRWTPANVWFPFAETVGNLASRLPDLLSFTGDQIYEGKPTQPEPGDRFPVYDYLYKWYLWHWAFGDLTRRRPAVCQVDDHDVYQGNIWGWGGWLNMTGDNNNAGYMMDPLFVRLVERTQCAHNPDPYDPAPLKNDIGVYFTGFSYGGVSFAVLEDRKFKSLRNLEDSQAELLGGRQLAFLEHWATDWQRAKMKVALSQSLYASVQTDKNGAITRDPDTGGWPKGGRDRAVKAIRKARALIVCGDQHLATLVRLGLETFDDGPVQFCVPALGNIFWRWFYPRVPGSGPLADPEGYRGDFTDGFGNPFRLLAAANPTAAGFMGDRDQTLRRWNSRPEANADSVRLCQGDGFGLVRIDTQARTYRIECWPYDITPGTADEKQYKGWPVTFTQQEIGGHKARYSLGRVEYQAGINLCAAVFDQQTNELVYCYPPSGTGEILHVEKQGVYGVLLLDADDPEGPRQGFSDLEALEDPAKVPVLSY